MAVISISFAISSSLKSFRTFRVDCSRRTWRMVEWIVFLTLIPCEAYESHWRTVRGSGVVADGGRCYRIQVDSVQSELVS